MNPDRKLVPLSEINRQPQLFVDPPKREALLTGIDVWLQNFRHAAFEQDYVQLAYRAQVVILGAQSVLRATEDHLNRTRLIADLLIRARACRHLEADHASKFEADVAARYRERARTYEDFARDLEERASAGDMMSARDGRSSTRAENL